jgi:hypothetical protein
MVDKIKSKMGKKSHAEGKAFEPRVFKDLLNLPVIPCRWTNDVKDDELAQAKTHWRKTKFGMFPLNLNPGFPDFCYFNRLTNNFVGVECKINNKLDKTEKEKCQWYLKNKIFDKFLVAYKTKEKNRVKVNYREIILEGGVKNG